MMSLAVEYAAPAAQLVAWGCHILVQSTLLITLGLAVNGLLRRRGAALRSIVLRGTLVAVLVCPVVSGVCGLGGVEVALPQGIHVVSASTSPATSPPMSDELGGSCVHVGSRLSTEPAGFVPAGPGGLRRPVQMGLPALYLSLSICWIVGAVLLPARLGCHYLRTRRLRSGAGPGPVHAVEICRDMAGRMGLKAPRVKVSPAVRSPLLIGVFRPVILLPEASPNMANAQVFAHELAHVWRRDCVWSIVSRSITALYFFQPLTWTLARQMEQANEEACDDVVLSYVGQRQSYAWRLVDMAQKLGCCPPESIGIGAVGLRSSLGRRVQRIVDSGTSHAIRTKPSEMLCVALLGSLAVSFVSLLSVRAAASGEQRDPFTDRAVSAETVEASVLPLVRALTGDQWQTREQAAITLAQMDGAKTAAIPALTDALTDEQWRVRKAAAVALTTVGSDAGDTVPSLIGALGDPEWQVRRPAAEALAAIGPASEPAVPALSNALSDEEWHVRRAAATALAAIGPASRPSMPQLLRTLDDEQWHVRESAALALGAIGPEAAAAIPALIRRLDDPEWRVRRATASALEEIAAGDKTAIPEIIDALRDSEWQRRQAAAESLERLLRR